MPLLQVTDLQVRYGRILGTNGISFSLEAGESLALVGSNGAGKSSTLKAILGMAEWPQGQILLDGQDLRGSKTSDIVRQGVGFSPEGRRVFPMMSVADNLRAGAFTRPREEAAERMEAMFAYFPRLRERAGQRASSLSGGEQQMLAIGRALMSRPRLLLLDEPSLGLAPIIVERIGEIIEEVQRREGLTFILAEQNANWAMRVAKRAVILELGRSTIAGDCATLLDDPRVQNAYLGL
ncbi:ABC transporter ATP-binding protein [Allostella vacuolata]|nr:ABC transporter ATP-binding protein [Stella vacuolata]